MTEELILRAERLEKKGNQIKAAQLYLEAGLKEKAAAAFENGLDYPRAQKLYEELGKAEDAERCKKKNERINSFGSFEEEQSKFQQDFGNPY